jgi:uncharacterized Zn finger protein
MAKLSRTWWGQRFLAVLEQITDPGRLSRGRSYRDERIKQFEISEGIVTANVKGSINPYFGVYKEPLYTTVIEFQPISAAKWAAAIALIASKASLISRLILNEMPDDIESAFTTLGLNILPREPGEFKSHCSCPDWGNPCKHVAGVYYRLATELDRDPFLLFELRGLSRQELHRQLAQSPLGQALVAELELEQRPPEAVSSYYTQPQTQPAEPLQHLREYWSGAKRLPQQIEPLPQAPVAGILVKQQGDFPAFWNRDNSFLEAMETLYEQVKTKNSAVL